jgi:diguanylate cyclase
MGIALTIEIPALPAETRRSIFINAAAITLAAVAASELVTLIASAAFSLRADVPAYLMAGIIPLLLAGPGSYWQLKRLEQVRLAYRELERVGSTDSLTGCLNRRAFEAAASSATLIGRPGALLVVEVRGLGEINGRLGHERGDEALRAIASVARARLDSTDLVGRLSGKQFGIYLRVASPEHAAELAESIREGVQDIGLASDDAAFRPSVNVGIATTTSPIGFPELLGIVEGQLRAAKQEGRDRIAITAAPLVAAERAAA